jgi:NAD(P)-dependent dehydrogenase (short-subunit alcohol dehydrogenase family)
MPDSLRGKVALVTGAAKRVGRAIALALAREGADVVIHYHSSKAEASDLVVELRAMGRRAWAIQGDLSRPANCARIIRQAVAQAGRLDILVNNASTFPARAMATITFDQFIADLRVNAWAPLELARQFARGGRAGQIINLLDTRIRGYDPVHAGYILAKHVLAQLTRMLAVELAPRIAVNAVAPGLILPPPGKNQAHLRKLASSLPLKRHGGPEDVARAVVYLAASRFVTGQVLWVDGGRHVREDFYGPHPH